MFGCTPSKGKCFYVMKFIQIHTVFGPFPFHKIFLRKMGTVPSCFNTFTHAIHKCRASLFICRSTCCSCRYVHESVLNDRSPGTTVSPRSHVGSQQTQQSVSAAGWKNENPLYEAASTQHELVENPFPSRLDPISDQAPQLNPQLFLPVDSNNTSSNGVIDLANGRHRPRASPSPLGNRSEVEQHFSSSSFMTEIPMTSLSSGLVSVPFSSAAQISSGPISSGSVSVPDSISLSDSGPSLLGALSSFSLSLKTSSSSRSAQP